MSHQGPLMHFPAVSPALFPSSFLLLYFQHLGKGERGFKITVYHTLYLEELTEDINAPNWGTISLQCKWCWYPAPSCPAEMGELRWREDHFHPKLQLCSSAASKQAHQAPGHDPFSSKLDNKWKIKTICYGNFGNQSAIHRPASVPFYRTRCHCPSPWGDSDSDITTPYLNKVNN